MKADFDELLELINRAAPGDIIIPMQKGDGTVIPMSLLALGKVMQIQHDTMREFRTLSAIQERLREVNFLAKEVMDG